MIDQRHDEPPDFRDRLRLIAIAAARLNHARQLMRSAVNARLGRPTTARPEWTPTRREIWTP